MITRALDNYFTNKFLNFIRSYILKYNLDLEVYFYSHQQVQIFLKKKKWKRGTGQYILGFQKQEAVFYLLNQKEWEKIIIEATEQFLKRGDL